MRHPFLRPLVLACAASGLAPAMITDEPAPQASVKKASSRPRSQSVPEALSALAPPKPRHTPHAQSISQFSVAPSVTAPPSESKAVGGTDGEAPARVGKHRRHQRSRSMVLSSRVWVPQVGQLPWSSVALPDAPVTAGPVEPTQVARDSVSEPESAFPYTNPMDAPVTLTLVECVPGNRLATYVKPAEGHGPIQVLRALGDNCDLPANRKVMIWSQDGAGPRKLSGMCSDVPVAAISLP